MSGAKKRSESSRERRRRLKLSAEVRRRERERRADRERERQQGGGIADHRLGGGDQPLPPEKLTIGARRERLHAEDGSVPEVLVRPGALRRLGLITKHQSAAERFLRDWEAAKYAGLQCRGFEPGVDGSKVHAAHLRQVEAQDRLRECRSYIGERNYDIVKAVLLYRANTNKVHAKGGRENRTVSNDIEIAFNSLAAFYSPGFQRADPNWKAFRKIIEEGEAYFAEADRQLRESGDA